eukprot:2456238-Rhodomonas_salina.3
MVLTSLGRPCVHMLAACPLARPLHTCPAKDHECHEKQGPFARARSDSSAKGSLFLIEAVHCEAVHFGIQPLTRPLFGTPARQ